MRNLSGILLPITTPFTSQHDYNSKRQAPADVIDANALTANTLSWNTTGIVGYVILGSTGERVHLDEREYLHVIEAARDAVPNELAFIVGAGEQSTLGT